MKKIKKTKLCFFVEFLTEAAGTICNKREQGERRRRNAKEQCLLIFQFRKRDILAVKHHDILLDDSRFKGCTLDTNAELPPLAFSPQLKPPATSAGLGAYSREPYRLEVTCPFSWPLRVHVSILSQGPLDGLVQPVSLFCLILIYFCWVENPQVLEYPSVAFSKSGSGAFFFYFLWVLRCLSI